MTNTLPGGGGDSPEARRDHPASIEAGNIIPPHNFEPGSTCIVVQRHQRYVNEAGHERLGSLTPEAEEQEWNMAYNYFNELLASTPPHERTKVKAYFVASDSDFKGEGGERSYETAVIAQQAAEAVFKRYGVDPATAIVNAGLNVRGGYSEINPNLREPQIFTDSPGFVADLRRLYPDFKDMMDAYEADRHADIRIQNGAEGPRELAGRLGSSIGELARYADSLHAADPDSRVVMWATSHYDTISPFVKLNLLNIGLEPYLPVEYGGGFTVEINPRGQARAKLGNRSYPLPINS